MCNNNNILFRVHYNTWSQCLRNTFFLIEKKKNCNYLFCVSSNKLNINIYKSIIKTIKNIQKRVHYSNCTWLDTQSDVAHKPHEKPLRVTWITSMWEATIITASEVLIETILNNLSIS